jgi:hypothetical protein
VKSYGINNNIAMKINVCDTHDCSEMTCDIEESSDYENLWKNKTKAGLLTSIKDRHQNLHFSFFFFFAIYNGC